MKAVLQLLLSIMQTLLSFLETLQLVREVGALVDNLELFIILVEYGRHVLVV